MVFKSNGCYFRNINNGQVLLNTFNTLLPTINLLESSSFFYVLYVNMEGKYSYVNSHYNKVFSSLHGSILNQSYEITMHPEDTKICQEVSVKCFANPDKVFPATIRKHDGNGGYFITQWDYKAVFTDQGDPDGIFCIGYDITQLVVKSTQLNKAFTEIEQRNIRLQEIAFYQSHLIRMPLTNILGLLDILLKMETDNSTMHIVKMLLESAQKLDIQIKQVIEKTYVR